MSDKNDKKMSNNQPISHKELREACFENNDIVLRLIYYLSEINTIVVGPKFLEGIEYNDDNIDRKNLSILSGQASTFNPYKMKDLNLMVEDNKNCGPNGIAKSESSNRISLRYGNLTASSNHYLVVSSWWLDYFYFHPMKCLYQEAKNTEESCFVKFWYFLMTLITFSSILVTFFYLAYKAIILERPKPETGAMIYIVLLPIIMAVLGYWGLYSSVVHDTNFSKYILYLTFLLFDTILFGVFLVCIQFYFNNLDDLPIMWTYPPVKYFIQSYFECSKWSMKFDGNLTSTQYCLDSMKNYFSTHGSAKWVSLSFFVVFSLFVVIAFKIRFETQTNQNANSDLTVTSSR